MSTCSSPTPCARGRPSARSPWCRPPAPPSAPAGCRLRRQADADRRARPRERPAGRAHRVHTLPRPRPVDGDRLGRGRAHRRRGGAQTHLQCRRQRLPHAGGRDHRRQALPISFPGQADQTSRRALARSRRAADALRHANSSPTTASSFAASARTSPSAPACRRRSSPGSTRIASGPTAWSTASSRALGAGRRGRRALCAVGDRAAARARRAVHATRRPGRRRPQGHRAAEALPPQPRRTPASPSAGWPTARRRTRPCARCVADPAIRACLDALYDEESCRSSPRRASPRRRPTARASSTGSATRSSTTA